MKLDLLTLNNPNETWSYPGQTTAAGQTFDGDNRLASVTDWSGNKTAFNYTADGQLAAWHQALVLYRAQHRVADAERVRHKLKPRIPFMA